MYQAAAWCTTKRWFKRKIYLGKEIWILIWKHNTEQERLTALSLSKPAVWTRHEFNLQWITSHHTQSIEAASQENQWKYTFVDLVREWNLCSPRRTGISTFACISNKDKRSKYNAIACHEQFQVLLIWKCRGKKSQDTIDRHKTFKTFYQHFLCLFQHCWAPGLGKKKSMLMQTQTHHQWRKSWYMNYKRSLSQIQRPWRYLPEGVRRAGWRTCEAALYNLWEVVENRGCPTWL